VVDFAAFPERKALLHVDMQNCFVERSPMAAPKGLAVDARAILLDKPAAGA
jgi:nicotinamidase-related amidase